MADKKMSRIPQLWIYLAGIAVIISIIAIVVVTFFIASSPQHYTLAQEAYLMGDYDTALEEFNNTINQNPNEANYFTERGLTHMNLQNYAASLADFNNAIALDPQSTDTRPAFYGGFIMLISENYDFAVELLSIAIERGESSAEVYRHRGLAFYNLGDYESAIIDVNVAISLDDTVANYYQILGDSYYAQENDDEALSAYNNYVELIPQADDYVIDNINAITEKRRKAPKFIRGDIRRTGLAKSLILM